MNWRGEEAPVDIPTVTTKEAESVEKTSAVLSGEIKNTGGAKITATEFVYWSKQDDSSRYTVTADENFRAQLKNLSPSTTYYYYAKASNTAGEGTGGVLSFETKPEEAPVSISITPAFVSLRVEETCHLLATVLPAGAENRNVIWSSSDPSVVRVSNEGQLTAVGVGSAVITAATEVNRLTATCSVEVTRPTTEVTGSFDFSEWNMAARLSNQSDTGFDRGIIRGGNIFKSTAYLARWDGAVLENRDPFPWPNIPQAIDSTNQEDYHVQEVLWLPARTSSQDNDEFKAAIMQYGGMYSSFWVDWKYFDAQRANYYHPESAPKDTDNPQNGGHAITIVGWDDDYPASNFRVRPEDNGAFICKNSWGPNSGENGFFYISYYDKFLGRSSDNGVVPSLETKTNYNKIYQYDPLGMCSAHAFKGKMFAANVFPQKGSFLYQDELLRAVSFYTYAKNMSYNIYIVPDYKDKNSLSSMGAAVASGTIKDMGYHTVNLDKSIELKAGNRFAVIVEINAPTAWFCYEMPIENKSSKARANPDESYYSGNGISWGDLTALKTDKLDFVNANYCIKAFTDNGIAAYSAQLFEGIDNDNREYTSDKVCTLDELLAAGAPVTKEYLDWIQQPRLFSDDNTGDPLGAEPPMFDTGGNSVSFVEGAVFPRRYDLRDENCVTGVGDQKDFGLCWTFATYGSLESCLLKKAKQLTAADSMMTGSDWLAAVADVGQSGIPATSLALSAGSAELSVGSVYRLAPVFTPANTTDTAVLWSSSNESIATVDTGGTVTAHQAGHAQITAQIVGGNLSASCDVAVTAGTVSVTGVHFTAAEVTKSVGEIFLADYTVEPASAANKAVTWGSSDQGIVSVNENGVMAGAAPGTATITVTTEDGGYTAQLIVTITDGDTAEDGMDFFIAQPSIKFQNDAVHITAEVQKKSGELNFLLLYAALYDKSGKMCALDQKTISFPENPASTTFTLPLQKKGEYYIKIFGVGNQSIPVAEMKRVDVKF